MHRSCSSNIRRDRRVAPDEAETGAVEWRLRSCAVGRDRPPLTRKFLSRTDDSGNQFLNALSPAVRASALSGALTRSFRPKETIAMRGDGYDFLHFPLSGAISEIEQGADGGSAEVTLVGFEGCSGVEALMDATAHPFHRAPQVPTTAILIKASHLLAIRDRSEELHALVHRYVAARLRGGGISIGCYARHPVVARLARWLLRMNDRMIDGMFDVTHDAIALMLGVRRPSVTRAIEELAACGAIAGGRSNIRIVDRAILEQRTCSCYPDARDLFAELYGKVPKSSEIS